MSMNVSLFALPTVELKSSSQFILIFYEMSFMAEVLKVRSQVEIFGSNFLRW